MNDQVPTRADVENKLLDLIEGRCSRDEALAWAEHWLYQDHELGRDLFNNPVLEALDALSGADAPSTDVRIFTTPLIFGRGSMSCAKQHNLIAA